MKHNFPLQRHVFLLLIYRILKRTTFSPPFCHDWQRVQETIKLHPRNIKMIKDDQEGTRNPYKCMKVMKQDAMDDKIIRRYKNMWKLNACKRFLTDREAVELLSSRSQPQWIENLSRICRPNRKFLDGSRSCQEAIEKNFRYLDGSKLC